MSSSLELQLQEHIVQGLEKDVQEYGVKPITPNLQNYYCTNPEGEILIKIAKQTNTYTSRRMNAASYDFNYLATFTIRLTLIETTTGSFDNIYKMSYEVEKAMRKIVLGGASQFYLLTAEEPEIEPTKNFIYRDLYFTAIIQTALEYNDKDDN